ncbi:hypothetical protein ACVIGB_008871 [Bradyrhizobium sp. USDA 4341]
MASAVWKIKLSPSRDILLSKFNLSPFVEREGA